MKYPARSRAKPAAPIAIDPRFAPVLKAFASDHRVTRTKMFSSESVLTIKGKIFAMFARDRFVAKLPKARVDEIVAAGQGHHFDPGHGRLMKEWIALPEGNGDWIELAKEACKFVEQSPD